MEAASAHARTPGASRAHSRLASPAPLVLDSWCEDESPSSASDLFDRPASWFAMSAMQILQRYSEGEHEEDEGASATEPTLNMLQELSLNETEKSWFREEDGFGSLDEEVAMQILQRYSEGEHEEDEGASATKPTLNMLQELSLNETTDSEKTGPTNFAAYDDPLSAV